MNNFVSQPTKLDIKRRFKLVMMRGKPHMVEVERTSTQTV